jgi:AraC family transcriptional regulator
MPGLTISAHSTLPPPSTANACILKGSIPEPISKDPSIASVSFLLQGNPIVEILNENKLKRLQINAGTFSITPTRSNYQYRTESAHTSLVLLIEDKSIQEFAQAEFETNSSRVNLITCLEGTQPRDLFRLGLSLSKLLETPRQGSALYAQALWIEIFLLQLLWHHSTLSKSGSQPNIQVLSQSRIEDVTEFMQANLAQDITLSDLASHVNLSTGYFLRSFKSATGKTPIQYRLEMRLTKARELLSHTALPISEVATMLGFSSHAQFSPPSGDVLE